jgi:hypothetical protein
MAAKGLDTGDKVLARAIAGRLIHALRQQCRRGLIDGTEKHFRRKGLGFAGGIEIKSGGSRTTQLALSWIVS